ncbi:hypothetical protein SHI21_16765 [Bacteriovorax sp. PP10]|uniref:Uncharacterized protein n=1 Tax=Bacteriovorax antarcticus TaxID=3088717 RepID=A0ABU5W239_9BACT|nr:hypothetical protein [Bacteriovorax sp. PP10]MEA9357885.1 hypothetical protein [Bacteriovorax sp. PP10]
MKFLMTLISLIFSVNAFAFNDVCIDISTNKYLTFSNPFTTTDSVPANDVLTQKESEEITNKELARMSTEMQAKMNPICNTSKVDADEILETFIKECNESLPAKDIDKGIGHTYSLLSRFCKENAQFIRVYIAGLVTTPRCDKVEVVDSSGRDKIKEVSGEKRLPPPPTSTLSK